MAHRGLRYWTGVVALSAATILLASQPLGLLAHLLEEHLAGHEASAQHDVAAHSDDAQGDHDADHGHVWMNPAVTVVVPALREPQLLAVLRVAEDLQQPSPASPPPFAPPRA